MAVSKKDLCFLVSIRNKAAVELRRLYKTRLNRDSRVRLEIVIAELESAGVLLPGITRIIKQVVDTAMMVIDGQVPNDDTALGFMRDMGPKVVIALRSTPGKVS